MKSNTSTLRFEAERPEAVSPAYVTAQSGHRDDADGTDWQRFRSSSRFGSLDGLRALSILAVIWHHTAPRALAGTGWAHFGAYGVTLFFAISGFLITTLLLRERDRNGSIDLRAFYVRRSLRIFPLYYAVLCAYVCLVFLMERHTADGREFFENLPYFATYTSNAFVDLDERVILYFAWSLATEEQFYLVWPPLLVLLRVPLRAVLLLTCVLVVLIYDELWGGFKLHAIPVAILGGTLLAMLLNTKRGYELIALALGRRLSAPMCLALVALALVVGVRSFVLQLAFVALVASCVMREDHLLASLLRLRPVVFIGSISYGMYLLHMLASNASQKLLGTVAFAGKDFALFPVTCLLAACAAYLSYRYFEQPFLRLKGRFSR